MQLKPIALAIMAATGLSACGGGSASNGSTLPANRNAASTLSYTACIDSNHNWQCDDGDRSKTVGTTGDTGMAPATNEYTLIESRNAQNRRTLLLVSEPGSAVVSGHSTLTTFLRAAGESENAISIARDTLLNTELEQGYSQAIGHYPQALTALDLYSRAAATQGSTAPELPAHSPELGNTTTLSQWQSSDSTSVIRQLSAQGSRVLNNSDTNRLYLFDAADTTIESNELDLIPLDTWPLAALPRPVLHGIAWLHDALNVVIDTASAATAFTGTPSTGSPVVLEPGQGIVAARMINQGQSAIVIMNMLNGSYTGAACGDTRSGNEGIFRVELNDSSSYRLLEDAPGCVHSGFNLLASDATGSNIAAWDSIGQRLWLLEGSPLQQRTVMNLKLAASTTPQALAMTPGGRVLAVAGPGHLVLVDVTQGIVLAKLTGSWSNVSAAAFANGARTLLLASGDQVHTFLLDDRFNLLSKTSHNVATASSPLKDLTVSPDGDSYVATSNTTAYWNSSFSEPLDTLSLANGLNVQQTVIADNQLLILARGAQDLTFTLQRIALDMPSTRLTGND